MSPTVRDESYYIIGGTALSELIFATAQQSFAFEKRYRLAGEIKGEINGQSFGSEITVLRNGENFGVSSKLERWKDEEKDRKVGIKKNANSRGHTAETVSEALPGPSGLCTSRERSAWRIFLMLLRRVKGWLL